MRKDTTKSVMKECISLHISAIKMIRKYLKQRYTHKFGKHVQDLYAENYKMLMEEIKRRQVNGEMKLDHGQEEPTY